VRGTEKHRETYNLAGQPSFSLSFEQPVEGMETFASGTMNLLKVIRHVEVPVRQFNAGSSVQCRGRRVLRRYGPEPGQRKHPLQAPQPLCCSQSDDLPRVANYRETYGLSAWTGILRNHESPLRPNRLVAEKIIEGEKAIAEGQQEGRCWAISTSGAIGTGRRSVRRRNT
jgi:GDPmannose 4,6-dehydratase